MTRPQTRCFVALALPFLAAFAAAAERPVTVSPGDASRVAAIAGSCPTFSWAGAEARAVELVVFEVDDRRAKSSRPPAPTVRRRLPGAATSWTPNRSACLDAGETYGWAVRAAGGDEWSEPRFFRVEAQPSPAEVEDALAVLRRYLDDRSGGAVATDETLATAAADGASRPASARASGVDRDGAGPSSSPGTLSHGTGDAFSIGSGGTVIAHAFVGDGSGLTGVNASTLQGSSPSAFSSSGHSHQLSELTVGTGAGPALVAPTVVGCVGVAGATSSCAATCPVDEVRVGGGCGNVAPAAGTPCNAAGGAVRVSRPAAVGEAWDCEVVCHDGSGDTEARGEVLCSATVP